MRTIELQWDDAKWGADIAELVVRGLLAGLANEGRVLPDKWMIRGPLIAQVDDPDAAAREFEPMTRRLVSLLTGERITEDE